MSAVQALTAARDAGVRIGIDGDALTLDADAAPPLAVLELLSRHKAGVVALLRRGGDGWSGEDWRIFFDERAASAEFEQGLQKYVDDMGFDGKRKNDPVRYGAELLFLIGDKPINELTHSDFFRYRTERLKAVTRFKRPISPLTVNREIEHARACLRHAKNGGYRMPDEMPDWSQLLDRCAERSAARVRELRPNEEAELFPTLRNKNPDLAAVVEFTMICGQRRAAVITLTHRQIDWANKQFTVLLKTRGATKRPHVVPLNKRLIEIIEAQPKVEGTDRVFTYMCRKTINVKSRPLREKGKRYPFTLEGWCKEWRKLLNDAGISDFKFHDLRHTTATRVVRQTGNIRVAQQILGHQDIKTTSRYAHADLDDVRRALEETQHRADQHQRELRRRRTALRAVA